MTPIPTCFTAWFGAAFLACTPVDSNSQHAQQVFAGIEGVRVAERRETYERGALLVTPQRLPNSHDQRLRVMVYLDLPGKLEGDAFETLVYPVGTQATRVEYFAPQGAELDALPNETWKVLDVRGLSVDPQGTLHFVLRPSGLGNAAELNGVSWRREEAEQGTARLTALVLRGAFEGLPAQRHAMASKLATLNHCNGCHQPNQRDDLDRLVHRGTDGGGFFQVAAVFRDHGPLETYRPRDANQDDPHTTLRCASGAAPSHEPMPRCTSGQVPFSTYDLRQALARGSQHALQICKARLYLADHMSEGLRAGLTDKLEPCR